MYSVNYDNYQNKLLVDKENMTQGSWSISPDMIQELKYAYAYLKNSEKMIVKKFTIKHFERNDTSKGYIDEDKQCFVFEKSEDVFFEYPYGTIQGRHYRNDEEMDALPRLEQGEIDRRLELARITPSSDNENKDRGRKRGAKDTAQVRLMKLWKAEYSHRQIPHFEVAKQMVSTVEKDPEQDLNALLDEHYLAEDKKDKHNH